VAELRRSTTLFIRCPDVDPIARLEQAQATVCAVQEILARYEGQMLRLGVDSRGPVVLAAFGLPPLAHENDAARAGEAALAIHAELLARGLRVACGLASGRVFAGTLGNQQRCEYTILGEVVNLANRLMDAAGDTVLCDLSTYQQAQTRLTFEPVAALRLKGRAALAPAYRPLGPAPRSSTPPATLVGRTSERATLHERLHRLWEAGSGGVVLIEGEAGIGKSRLIADLLVQAQALGLRCLVGAGDAIERGRPYQAWYTVFEQLLGLEGLLPDGGLRREHVLAHLAAMPARAASAGTEQMDMRGQAPLLGTPLGLLWPDNEVTRHQSGESRADNTRELLVQILQAATQTAPLVVVLEDAHWLDSTSWALLRLVSWRVERLLLVLATRPLPVPVPDEYAGLVQAADTQRLLLEALTEDEVVQLICRRLGVTAVPEPVSTLVFTRAEGHPFFSEELVYALRDAGLIVVGDGICRLTVGTDELAALDLPSTVEGVITSRIDRLTPAQQLTLKVASVIGRVFPLRTLEAIHPLPEQGTGLRDDLSTLTRLNITPVQVLEPNPSYIFKHSITQEVTYNLLLRSQRRQLHRAVAEWYEQAHAHHLSAVYPLMGYHWSRAIEDARAEPEVATRAIAILDQAAEQAIRSDANQEVILFLGEALRLNAERAAVPDGDGARLQQARWERQLGEAYFRLGNATEARGHLQRTLMLLEQPVATTPRALLASTLAQLARQAAHRALPSSPRAPAAQQAGLLEAARAYETHALIAYISEDRLGTIDGNLHGLNLGERADPSPGLALSYAMIGLIAGLSALHGPAEYYFRRALVTGHAVDDPSCLGRVWYNRVLYAAGRAEWAVAQRAQARAQAIFERYGDQRWRDTALAARGLLLHFQSNLQAALAQFNDLAISARQRGDVQVQAWATAGLASTYALLGRPEEALRSLQVFETHRGIQQGLETDPAALQGTQAVRSLLYARRGEHAAALEIAEATLLDMQRHASLAFYSVSSYRCLTETLLLAWDGLDGRQPAARKQLITMARTVHKLLRPFARVLPIGKPQLWLSEGTYACLLGQRAHALSAWRRALAAARRHGMPYEEGAAHFEIGRHLSPRVPARGAHLERALEIFQRCNARYRMERVQEALALAPGAAPAPPAR
jgi:tetratricopeptide (TPR) repeat protein